MYSAARLGNDESLHVVPKPKNNDGEFVLSRRESLENEHVG